MACGLSYGELLLLCTLISFDWVVHGVRVLPATPGAELQVVEEVGQVAHDLDLISQQVTSSRSETFTCIPEHRFDLTPQISEQNWSSDITWMRDTQCPSLCLDDVKCRAYGLLRSESDDVEISVCRLYSENFASAVWDVKFNNDPSYSLCNRDMLSGFEDFKVPLVGYGIPNSNFETIVDVANASDCAEICRKKITCHGIEFFTEALAGRCQLRKSTDGAPSYTNYPGIWYYERWQMPIDNSNFMGPFVGTGIALPGGVSSQTTYTYEKSAAACLSLCSATQDCTSFGWKARGVHAAGSNKKKAACYVYNGTMSTVGSAYKSKLWWDYYELLPEQQS